MCSWSRPKLGRFASARHAIAGHVDPRPRRSAVVVLPLVAPVRNYRHPRSTGLNDPAMGLFDFFSRKASAETFVPAYASFPEHQLRKLWSERETLTDVARNALEKELEDRGISTDLSGAAKRSTAVRRSFHLLTLEYDFPQTRQSIEAFAYCEPAHILHCVRQVLAPEHPEEALQLFSTDGSAGARGRSILFRIEDGVATEALEIAECVQVSAEGNSRPLRAPRGQPEIVSLHQRAAQLSIDWTRIEGFVAKPLAGSPLQSEETAAVEFPAPLRKQTFTGLEANEDFRFGFEDLFYGEDVARDFIDPTKLEAPRDPEAGVPDETETP